LRFFRFCLVGATVAAVDFATIWLLMYLLPPLIAVSIAYFTGVTCHFLLNKFWVFRCSRSDYLKQLLQYLSCVSASWLTTITIVHFFLLRFNSSVLLAKLWAIPPASLVTFLMMQLFVFRKPAPVQEATPEENWIS
jgi:putative flippase GtrA